MALGFMNIKVCNKNAALARVRGDGDFSRLTITKSTGASGSVDVAGKSANITCDAASYDALLVGRTISIAYDDRTQVVSSVSVQTSNVQRSIRFAFPSNDDGESLETLGARLAELTELVREEFAALHLRLDELEDELHPRVLPRHRLTPVDASGGKGAAGGAL